MKVTRSKTRDRAAEPASARPAEVGTAAGARKAAAADYPRLEIDSRAALRRWLLENHRAESGVWVVTRKRAAGGAVTWNDVVEEALCFGWIDSLPRKVDAERSMLLVTCRKPKSKWSAKNQAHVAELERRGLMQPAGRAAVRLAQANGCWSALDRVTSLAVPADLAQALADQGRARAHWDAFPPSIKRGILEWIDAAKREKTRAARVSQTARLAQDNLRANQWPRANVPRKSS